MVEIEENRKQEIGEIVDRYRVVVVVSQRQSEINSLSWAESVSGHGAVLQGTLR